MVLLFQVALCLTILTKTIKLEPLYGNRRKNEPDIQSLRKSVRTILDRQLNEDDDDNDEARPRAELRKSTPPYASSPPDPVDGTMIATEASELPTPPPIRTDPPETETTEQRLKPRRTTIPTTTTTTTSTTTTKPPIEEPEDEGSGGSEEETLDIQDYEESFPSKMHFIIIGSVVAVVVLLSLLCCLCCRGGADQATTKSQYGEQTKTKTGRKKKSKKKKGSDKSQISSSSLSVVKVKAKKMEAEKINMMEFADKGALVMQDVKGEVKHALDAEKSAEIIRVQYDTGQNEIVTIGSDVEIIKSSSQITDDAKQKTKSIAGPATMKKGKTKLKSVRH